MLPLILATQVSISPHRPAKMLESTPTTHQGIERFLQKHRTQQIEQKLNTTQRQYQLEKEQLQILPPSRLDCFPLFPPVQGL